MRRGDVYIVSIPFATGREIQKTRPAVILSSDEANCRFGTVLVAFCTSQKTDSPYHATTCATIEQSTVLCEQIFTVDKTRLLNFVGTCSDEELAEIDRCVDSLLGYSVRSSEDCVREETTVCARASRTPVPSVCLKNGKLSVSIDGKEVLEVAV